MVDFSKLPDELIQIIINYTGIVVFRHGKYLDRISKDDYRYNIINRRRLPIWFGQTRWTFYFKFYDNIDKRAIAMEHEHDKNNNHHYLTQRECIKYDDGSISTKTQARYIFDLNGECRKIINYTM